MKGADGADNKIEVGEAEINLVLAASVGLT